LEQPLATPSLVFKFRVALRKYANIHYTPNIQTDRPLPCIRKPGLY
jgi:hypothetical protein